MRTALKCLAIVLALAAITQPGIVAGSSHPHLIGVIAPTSGPAAFVGTRHVNVILWWEEQVNGRGGIHGRQVKVLRCNDEANPVKAATCARDLLSKGVTLLLNASLTGAIRATMPLVSSGPVMIVSSPNIVPAPTTYVFQTSPSDHDLAQSIANLLASNNVRRLGMVAATDASGEAAVASAKAIFPKAGIDLTIDRIDLLATDASTQLAALVSKGVPVLYSAYTGGGAATIVKSATNLGLKQPLIVNYGNITYSFVDAIKGFVPARLLGTALKAMVPDVLMDAGERSRTVAFARSFEQKGGERIDQLNLMGVLLADIAEAVLTNVGDPSNAEAVKKYLETTPVKSVQTLRFSAQRHVGLSVDDATIVELKSGAWVKAARLE